MVDAAIGGLSRLPAAGYRGRPIYHLEGSSSRTLWLPLDCKESGQVFNVLLFVKAVLAGFIVAVPIGAIGAMCLRRALQGRWLAGLVTGLGAALADAVLATAAMLGLTLLTHYLLENQRPVLLVGGVFLIGVGIRMIRTRHPKLSAEVPTVYDQLRRWRVWAERSAPDSC